MAKRCSYTAAYKLYLVDIAERLGNRATGREHGVSEKLIRDWRRQKSELRKLPATARSQRVGDKPYWPELEVKLHKWVLDKQSKGEKPSSTKIRLKARAMAREMPSEFVEGFSASPSWLYRFRRRKGLLNIKKKKTKGKVAQRLPQEIEEKISNFHKMVAVMRRQTRYDPQHIGNMDEIKMTFDLPSAHTLTISNTDTPASTGTIVTSEKIQLTVALACLADGTKLPPMVVLKPKMAPPLGEHPPGVAVYIHTTGSMDHEGMRYWVEQVWANRPGGLTRKRSCLFYDDTKPHLLESIRQHIRATNTELAIIQTGLTPHLLPLDISVSGPFRQKMAELWWKWLVAVTSGRKGERVQPPGGLEWCLWVAEAWRQIDADTIVRGFQNSGILSRLHRLKNSTECDYEEDADDETVHVDSRSRDNDKLSTSK